MDEEQENIHPNTELKDLIRENINYQHDQSVKRTLIKESMLKMSLDKDFRDLFDRNQKKQTQANHANQVPQKCKGMIEVSEEIKEIVSWLEDSEDFSGIAYLPYTSTAKLVQIIHQKVENTAIIVTEYPSFWIKKMEQMGRLSKLQWGCLSTSQDSQEKVKVLELYEIKKLKLLFITPSLFKYEEYHEFQCDLLMFCDLHIYQNQSSFVSKIIAKTKPGKVLALYHTLMQESYEEHIKNNFKHINKPRSNKFNFICLKSQENQKFKTMMSYLIKNQLKKILIIVNKKQQATNLNKRLLMESKTSINLFDVFNQIQMASFAVGELWKRMDKDNEEEKAYQVMRKVSSCDITISSYMDFLRFGNYDIVVYYSFTDVVKFVESCSSATEKLMLLADDDYHNLRNSMTSELVTLQNLMKIVMKIVEKPIKREENSKKRYYSDAIDDKLFDCFSISKQYAEKDEQKVLKINFFSRKYEISPKLFTKISQALQKNQIIGINYRTICQIQIQPESLQCLKRKLPKIEQIRRKVNLLNVSTSLHKTTRNILDEIKNEGIKYKISEQALQIKILKNFEDINWDQIIKSVNENVQIQVASIDKSFEIYKDCAYSSIELTKRQKVLQKKELFLNFLNPSMDQSRLVSSNSILTESFHRSNLLTSEIEEWLRHSEQIIIDEHDLVLLLQGVEKGRIARFKDDPIYGRYRKLKYQELMEAVIKIYRNKMVKVD